MPVKGIKARQIFDSRGNPTIEVDLVTDKGMFRAAVPSGASTGIHEALELKDTEKGVTKAIDNVNNIIGPSICGMADIDEANQGAVDKILLRLDGTENKSKLGANAILGVSLAICKAGAAKKGVPLYKHIADLAGVKEFVLPVPAFNVINGGSHAGNKLAIQEFMILPTGAKNFHDAMKMGSETYHHLRNVINDKYGQDACNVGDEGGFAPNIQNNEEGLELLKVAIEKAGYTGKIEIGINVAASEFLKNGKYDLDFKDPKSDASKHLTADQMLDMYKGFVSKYPVVTIEDGYDQDAWDEWTKMTATMANTQIVGGDMLKTNPERVKQGIDKKACNCLLLKVNQIGSVTEAIEACKMAQAAGWGCMLSQRSGETEDTFIADLAVGLGTGQIKTGAPSSERLAKYNQLIRIEEELGSAAKYAGSHFRNPLKCVVGEKRSREDDNTLQENSKRFRTEETTEIPEQASSSAAPTAAAAASGDVTSTIKAEEIQKECFPWFTRCLKRLENWTVDALSTFAAAKMLYIVLDSNAVIHFQPQFIKNTVFQTFGNQAMLVIPYTLLQELDNLSRPSAPDLPVKRLAKAAVLTIRGWFSAKDPQVFEEDRWDQAQMNQVYYNIVIKNNDDRFVVCALQLPKKFPKVNVLVLTKDANMHLKSLTKGLHAMSVEMMLTRMAKTTSIRSFLTETEEKMSLLTGSFDSILGRFVFLRETLKGRLGSSNAFMADPVATSTRDLLKSYLTTLSALVERASAGDESINDSFSKTLEGCIRHYGLQVSVPSPKDIHNFFADKANGTKITDLAAKILGILASVDSC